MAKPAKCRPVYRPTQEKTRGWILTRPWLVDCADPPVWIMREHRLYVQLHQLFGRGLVIPAMIQALIPFSNKRCLLCSLSSYQIHPVMARV